MGNFTGSYERAHIRLFLYNVLYILNALRKYEYRKSGYCLALTNLATNHNKLQEMCIMRPHYSDNNAFEFPMHLHSPPSSLLELFRCYSKIISITPKTHRPISFLMKYPKFETSVFSSI